MFVCHENKDITNIYVTDYNDVNFYDILNTLLSPYTIISSTKYKL